MQLTRINLNKVITTHGLQKKLVCFLIFIFPLIVIILGELGFKSTFLAIESHFVNSAIYGGLGVLLFAVIYRANVYALNLLNLKPMFFGNRYSLF